MADKYSKLDNKIHPVIIISIVSFILIIVALIIVLQPTPQKRLFNQYKNAGASKELTEDHPFVSINYRNGFLRRGLRSRIQKNEIVFVLIGGPDCETCVSNIGYFQKYFESENMTDFVSNIYHLNPTQDTRGITLFTEDFEDITGETPQFAVFLNGEVLTTFKPTSTDSQAMMRDIRDFFKDVRALLEA